MAQVSESVKSNMKLANAATIEARTKLIAAHRDEYEGYLGDARVSRGLSRQKDAANPEILQKRKAKLEAQLQRLNQQLGI